ncbi:TNF receptor-associated factor 6 isoform X5 [Hydra vulgaris]|uniref:TNF receptor-associated factor 6 isoform X5 n=2 Tax=Hydra vulgaris TaxID=6087 RepID=A0ABM4BDT4_HYDVU
MRQVLKKKTIPTHVSIMLAKDNSVTEEIFQQGYDEHFDPPAPDVYECPICLLVLNAPVQTECGHRFCRGCILKVLREGRPNCPIDNYSINEEQIYPDNFALREILELKVRCQNSKTHSCKWLGSLKMLKEHMMSCEYNLFLCTNNCGEKMTRNALDKHCLNDCPKRVISCEFCKLKIVFKKLQDHYERCEGFPVNCPNVCEVVVIPRGKLKVHMEEECSRAILKCSFKDAGCQFQGTRDEVTNHMKTENHQFMLLQTLCDLKLRVANQEKVIESFKDKENTFNKESSSAAGFSLKSEASIVGRFDELEKKINQVKATSEVCRSELKHTRSELESRIESINIELKAQNEVINEVSARTWKGNFIWRISNFDQLFRQALSGEVPAIHSLPFYTGVPGYKMCLRINLNGIDSGAGTHVSMFVHMMQGEFDSLIEWPFPGSVIFTILDQDTRDPQHVCETLTARPTLQAFLRPKINRNHKGYGYIELIRHTTLRTRGYISNDTLLVRVDIKMPPTR